MTPPRLFPILLAATALAQSPSFEVVSIKPSPPDAGSTVSSGGGPGTRSPETWNCRAMTLHNIVWIGFNLRLQQLVAPEWMKEPRFDITAKVPAGATREQFYTMFQNMLVERFGLKFHRAEKEVDGFQLVIAKNGPKLKESTAPPPAPPDPNQPRPVFRPTLGADGFPEFPSGATGISIMRGRGRARLSNVTIQRLVSLLDDTIGKPVVDATGLTGKYELDLHWVAADPLRPDAGGPNVFAAVQEQLGLKLEPKKTTVPLVIVDHAEKVPTEN